MIERNELITICRQIGGMMEAGVDILRITRVMRAQTDNPRLLQLYDALDHDMTMGRSLAEAMSRAPDVFSPFVVQIVQQGEARNDLSGAFLKVADFLRQEQDLAHEEAASTREPLHRETSSDKSIDAAPANAPSAPNSMPASPLTVIALDGLFDRLQIFLLRALTVMSGLMLSLACVWWSLELGFVERRWSLPLAFSVTAVFLGVAGILIQRGIKSNRQSEERCSFCGQRGIGLQRSPRFAGAAICARCATIVAKKSLESEETENEVSGATTAEPTLENNSNDAVSHSQDEEASVSTGTSWDKGPFADNNVQGKHGGAKEVFGTSPTSQSSATANEATESVAPTASSPKSYSSSTTSRHVSSSSFPPQQAATRRVDTEETVLEEEDYE